MALFPCDRHGNRVAGPNFTAYIAFGAREDFERHFLRLCTLHSRELQDWLYEFELDPDGYTVRNNRRIPTCAACRQPIHEVGRQLFVTHYPTKHERKDYWTELHDDCPLPDILKPVQRPVFKVPS